MCVCTLNLGSVFTLPFVYHWSVCAAVNIRQQLDLRVGGPPRPPQTVHQNGTEWRNSGPRTRRQERDATSALTPKPPEQGRLTGSMLTGNGWRPPTHISSLLLADYGNQSSYTGDKH